MPMPASPLAGNALSFDRQEAAQASGPQVADVAHCASCTARLTTYYYDVEGTPACGVCKEKRVRAAAPLKGTVATVRSLAFGLAASLIGAVVYCAVISVTDFEIGLVAVLTGYIVGWSLRRGAGDRGGRRLQVAGVALTYLSVALAYTPLAMKGAVDEAVAQATADSIAAAEVRAPAMALGAHSSAAAQQGIAEADVEMSAAYEDDAVMSGPRAFLVVLSFVLALPLFVIFGSMPIGLVSALIIGFGMRQAWRMTAATRPHIAGPLRVATHAEAAPLANQA